MQRIEDNINANKKAESVIVLQDASIIDLENEIFNNSVYADHAQNKNVTLFGKEIEGCKNEIKELEDNIENDKKKIERNKIEIEELKEKNKQAEKDIKDLGKKNRKTRKKIEGKENDIKINDGLILEKQDTISKLELGKDEKQRSLNELNRKLKNLQEKQNNLKSFKSKVLTIRVTEKLERICNTKEFKSGMLVLSFTNLVGSFNKMMEEPSRREAVNLISCATDFAAISIDVAVCLKLSMYGDPIRARAFRMVVSRGATKISTTFGVVSSTVSTIGIFMDMQAARMKRDETAYMGYGLAGMMSSISAIASFTLLIGSIKAVSFSPALIQLLSLCNIIAMVSTFTFIILVAIFSDDKFETFLKAIVFYII